MESTTPLILVGMHRSGTSLVASLLQSSGLHIGEKLLGEGIGNIKGHYENIDFFEFHKAVLQSQGISEHGWTLQDKIFVEKSFIEQAKQIIKCNAVEPCWGWKDPRTTLFLDFWRNLLPDAKFLLIYRAPWEVVDSLYRRGTDEIFSTQPDLAVKVWLHYNSKIKEFYDNHPDDCLLVGIDSIVDNPQGYIDAINFHFKSHLSPPDKDIFEASLFKKLDNCNRSGLIAQYFPEVIALFQEIETRRWHLEDNVNSLNWQNLLVEYPHKSWVFSDWQTSSYLNAQRQRLRIDLDSILNDLETAKAVCYQSKKLIEDINKLVIPCSEQSRKSKSRTFARQILRLILPLEQIAVLLGNIEQARKKLAGWQQKIQN